jgi:hypothetical protein
MITSLNVKLRRMNTSAKRLKTEYDVVVKKRGRELLTLFSNECLRLQNTIGYFCSSSSKSSSSSSSSLFLSEDENALFYSLAIRKRKQKVFDLRKDLELEFRPIVSNVLERFRELLHEIEHEIDDALLEATSSFAKTNFKFTHVTFMKQYCLELETKLAVVDSILEHTATKYAFVDTSSSSSKNEKKSLGTANDTTVLRNTFLVSIAIWFLEPSVDHNSVANIFLD